MRRYTKLRGAAKLMVLLGRGGGLNSTPLNIKVGTSTRGGSTAKLSENVRLCAELKPGQLLLTKNTTSVLEVRRTWVVHRVAANSRSSRCSLLMF
jgi:hypothetical protein